MARLADGGERTAFGPAFELLWPEVSAFAARLLPGADAEDAAQQALLKIFARAPTYDRTRDALAWVLTLTAYEYRTIRRKRKRLREQFRKRLERALGKLRRAIPAPESPCQPALRNARAATWRPAASRAPASPRAATILAMVARA